MTAKRKLEVATGQAVQATSATDPVSGGADSSKSTLQPRNKKARFAVATTTDKVKDSKASDSGLRSSSTADADAPHVQASPHQSSKPRSKSSRHLSQAGNGKSSIYSLPGSLDLNDHLQAHASQIRAVSSQLKNGRGTSSTRAWQMLPRAERRRAASHNLLALPKRLRTKGASELKSSNTEATKRKDVRKQKGRSGSAGGYPRIKERARRKRLLERAGEQPAQAASPALHSESKGKWLETHLWHAKRFRMTGVEDKVVRRPRASTGAPSDSSLTNVRNRWGYNLAEQPSSKGFKAAIKACKEAVAVHDASYWQCLRVGCRIGACAVGDEEQPRMKLKDMLCRSGLSLGREDQDGRAAFATLVGPRHQYLAPVTVLWLHDPTLHSSANEEALPEYTPSDPSADQEAMQVDVPPIADRVAKSSTAPSRRNCVAEAILMVHPAGLAALRAALKSSIALERKRIRARKYQRKKAETGSTFGAASSSDTCKEPKEEEGQEHVYVQVLRPAAPPLCSKSDSMGRRHGKSGPFKLNQKLQTKAKSSCKLAPHERVAMRKQQEGVELDERRREGFNVFQLSGPRSGRLLGSVLRPVARNDAAKRHAFKVITSILKPDQVRRGTMLGLQVHDPRLSNPRTVKKEVLDGRKIQQMGGSLEVLWDRPLGSKEKELEQDAPIVEAEQMSRTLAQSALLARGCDMPRISKGEVDSLKARNLIPGTPLRPSSTSQTVSILIIAHRDPVPGYTLLVPRGWGRAFFHSLVSCKPAVLCLASLASLSAQFGKPIFPFDHPGCPAYDAWEAQQVQREKNRWERTPPAKRVSWDSAGTKFPWGGEELWTAAVMQSCTRSGHKVSAKEARAKPYLSVTREAPKSSDTPSRDRTWHRCLTQVRISAIKRGHFGPFTEIHMPTREEEIEWRRALQDADTDAQSVEGGEEPEFELAGSSRTDRERDQSALRKLEQTARVSSGSLMGATTSGTFSLAEGKACAMGVIASIAVRELRERAASMSAERSHVATPKAVPQDGPRQVEGAAEEAEIRLGADSSVVRLHQSTARGHLVLTKERQSTVWRAAELVVL